MKRLIRLVYIIATNALALFLASRFLPGFFFDGGWMAPIVFALILVILNAIVKPIAKFLAFPLVFLTGGLFLIVLNAAMLWLAEYIFIVADVEGLSVSFQSPLTYLWAAIIFGVANWLIHWILKDN